MKPKDYIKAMTTGRWPPKPEEEMISPGTERAIVRASEQMSPLIKSLDSVSEKLETWIKTMEKVGPPFKLEGVGAVNKVQVYETGSSTQYIGSGTQYSDGSIQISLDYVPKSGNLIIRPV